MYSCQNDSNTTIRKTHCSKNCLNDSEYSIFLLFQFFLARRSIFLLESHLLGTLVNTLALICLLKSSYLEKQLEK